MVGRRALLASLVLSLAAGPSWAETTTNLTALSPSAAVTATALTETALVPLEPYKPETNKPIEDFFVVTIISLPFTALWSIVGAAVIGGIAQKQFPPNFSNDALLSTAAIAVGSSLTVGLLSVSWGKGKTSKTITTK